MKEYLLNPVPITGVLIIIFYIALLPAQARIEAGGGGVSGEPENEGWVELSTIPPLSAQDPCLLTNVICGYEKQNQQVFGYSSTIDQTDPDPFTTASGSKVRKGIIANNCYPFGTWVIVRGEIYTLEDRMNSRYGCNDWDIWFETRQEALNWGHPYLTIEIL